MSPLWILVFVFAFSRRATCDYQCTMKTSEVTCSGINSDQLSQKVSVTLNKTDIVSLNLTNGLVSTISPTTFENFTNLQSLYVSNCQVSNLEDNGFSHSLDLKDLYLNNNTLTKFNVRSLPPENGLTVLDLSYNLLEDLSDFNLSYFPKLNVLNLANNFLSYLPVNLLTKLKEQNQFYLGADNNPWNCDDSNWSEHLTEKLVKAFCFNKTSNYNSTLDINIESTTSEVAETTNQQQTSDSIDNTTESNININSLQPFIKGPNFEKEYDDNETSESERDIQDYKCEKLNCAKCSFNFCLYWFIGGIWIGIILGNVCKIKNLVCSKTVMYSDHSTQCENTLTDQYMVSGFHLDFNRKTTRSNNSSQAVAKQKTVST